MQPEPPKAEKPSSRAADRSLSAAAQDKTNDPQYLLKAPLAFNRVQGLGF